MSDEKKNKCGTFFSEEYFGNGLRCLLLWPRSESRAKRRGHASNRTRPFVEWRRARILSRVGRVLDPFSQGTNTLTDPLAEVRKLLGAKHQQRDEKDYQKVHRLKDSFKHKNAPQSLK